MNDNSLLYAMLPTLSSKAKDKLQKSERNKAFLMSFLLTQGTGGPAANNPVYPFLTSQQVVDKEIALAGEREAQSRSSAIQSRFEAFAKEGGSSTAVLQNTVNLLQTIQSAVEQAASQLNENNVEGAKETINSLNNQMVEKRQEMENVDLNGFLQHLRSFVIAGQGKLPNVWDFKKKEEGQGVVKAKEAQPRMPVGAEG